MVVRRAVLFVLLDCLPLFPQLFLLFWYNSSKRVRLIWDRKRLKQMQTFKMLLQWGDESDWVSTEIQSMKSVDKRH